MATNAAYTPDRGMLVPIVMVSPLTPVVSLAPFGHADVSMIVELGPSGLVLPPGLLPAGLAVERLPPHADARSETATRQTTTPPARARNGRALRRSFMAERPLGSADSGRRRGRGRRSGRGAGPAGLARRVLSVRRLHASSRRAPPTTPSGNTYMSTINVMPKIAGETT